VRARHAPLGHSAAAVVLWGNTGSPLPYYKTIFYHKEVFTAAPATGFLMNEGGKCVAGGLTVQRGAGRKAAGQ